MTVSELTRDQLIQLKRHYMIELADSGEFAEVMGTNYDCPSYEVMGWDYGCPSYGDLANADELIPDDVIFEHYGDIEFSEDDFWP